MHDGYDDETGEQFPPGYIYEHDYSKENGFITYKEKKFVEQL